MSALAHVGGGPSAPAEVVEPPKSARNKALPYLLLLPGIAWLTIFFLIPSIFLLSTSLQTGNPIDGYSVTWRFANYADALSQYWPQFLRSFVYASIATALSLLLSFPLAYTIALKAGRWRNVLLVLVIAPFFTSFLIRTLAWLNILGDNSLLVETLKTLHLMPEDGRLLATPFAVICGLTYNFLPFMTLPLYASLERLDPRLVEAAGDLYASPFTGFRKVTVPLVMPGIVAGTLLTFIPAAGDYINAQLLGTPQTYMVGNVIDSRLLSVRDYPTAAALSFLLMMSIVVIVIAYVRRAGTEQLV